MPTPVNITDTAKSELKSFAQKYEFLSKLANNHTFFNNFVLAVDKKLYKELTQDASHPKDTGLMKKSWVIPEDYVNRNTSKECDVFLENTATVGQQYQLKYGKALYSAGNYTYRGRRGLAGRRLRRYMPYVDDKTKFYTKKLRIVTQQVHTMFKKYLYYTIMRPHIEPQLSSYSMRPGTTYWWDFGDFIGK